MELVMIKEMTSKQKQLYLNGEDMTPVRKSYPDYQSLSTKNKDGILVSKMVANEALNKDNYSKTVSDYVSLVNSRIDEFHLYLQETYGITDTKRHNVIYNKALGDYLRKSFGDESYFNSDYVEFEEIYSELV